MARDPEIKVIVDSDVSGATSGLSKAQAATVGFSAAAGTAIANYAEKAVKAAVDVAQAFVDQASALQQSTGAVESVFGDMAGAVEKNASRASKAMGLSTNAYQELASVLGSQLKNAGQPMSEVVAQTDKLIAVGSDLAATYGGSVADAVGAVSSLMRGERDPIERYGVSISQASVEAYKAAHGLQGLTGAAKTAADQQATLALLFDQTADAQGAFARESDTLAGSQAILNASWEDAQAALGEALLPLLTVAAQALTVFADFAKNNAEVLQILTVVLIATAAAVWAMNIAMAANPVGLVIIAVGLLVAAIAILIVKWDDVVAAFMNGLDQIGSFFRTVAGWISDAWENMVAGLRGVWDGFVGWIQGTIDSLIGWIRDAINWFGSLFGAANKATNASRAANAVSASNTAPQALSAMTLSTFSAPTVGNDTGAAARAVGAATYRAQLRDSERAITITVNGALDPNAVSKQISGLLRKRNARIGLGAAAGVRA